MSDAPLEVVGSAPVEPRVALVTGAARGIGAAVVRALAQAGYAVVAVDRAADDPRLPYPMGSATELAAVAREADALAGGAGRVCTLALDAADEAELARAVALAERRYGGLDVVVAAAGVIGGGTPLWEMGRAELDAVLDVDLRGPIAAARVGIPALLRRAAPRHGRFVAVASAAAVRGLPMLAAYCAAKGGVTALVRALAAELRGTGVTANAVSPGSTDTPILAESARLYGLRSAADFAAEQPIERLLDPAEVAAAIVWLAAKDRDGVTGADLAVDGGLSV